MKKHMWQSYLDEKILLYKNNVLSILLFIILALLLFLSYAHISQTVYKYGFRWHYLLVATLLQLWVAIVVVIV
jgi:hypothetical protein